MIESTRWEEEFPKLGRGPGTVIMILGGPDTGKTTLARFLTSKFLTEHRKVGYIDTDIGQSSIGMPGTLSLAVYEGEDPAVQEQPLVESQFVGSLNPVGFLVPILIGARRLLDRAWKRGAEVVVIDTHSLVRGAAAHELKQRKLDLLQPQHVLAVQKSAELEPILAPYRFSQCPLIHRLEAPTAVKPKSVEARRAAREERFRRYFAEAASFEIGLRDVGLWGTWLGKGRRLSAEEVRYLAKILAVEVLYGESEYDSLYAITRGEHSTREIFRVRNHFGTSNLKVIPAQSLENRLLSLNNDNESLALGLIERIDFQSLRLRVLTPMKTTERIQRIYIGALRLEPSGREIT